MFCCARDKQNARTQLLRVYPGKKGAPLRFFGAGGFIRSNSYIERSAGAQRYYKRKVQRFQGTSEGSKVTKVSGGFREENATESVSGKKRIKYHDDFSINQRHKATWDAGLGGLFVVCCVSDLQRKVFFFVLTRRRQDCCRSAARPQSRLLTAMLQLSFLRGWWSPPNRLFARAYIRTYVLVLMFRPCSP